ncbi:dihydroxyacetone kinase subunit DhaK [Nocardia sp. NPDC004568]|uniref:dihydroxyacetone kinase subunit DhaK n=1 Tax=Nocardia sp. NPDC004568 TaxID=3154551 RepID=UPI0033AA56A8
MTTAPGAPGPAPGSSPSALPHRCSRRLAEPLRCRRAARCHLPRATAPTDSHQPGTAPEEAFEGLALTNPTLVRYDRARGIVPRATPARDKVGLVSGGGSGHEPLHAGFVGRGMLEVAVPGAVFAGPTALLRRLADRGVLGTGGISRPPFGMFFREPARSADSDPATALTVMGWMTPVAALSGDPAHWDHQNRPVPCHRRRTPRIRTVDPHTASRHAGIPPTFSLTPGSATERSSCDFVHRGIGPHVENGEQDHSGHRHIRHVPRQGNHRASCGSTAFLDEIHERRGKHSALWCGLVEYGTQLVSEGAGSGSEPAFTRIGIAVMK